MLIHLRRSQYNHKLLFCSPDSFLAESIGLTLPAPRPGRNREDSGVGEDMLALAPIQPVNESTLDTHLDVQESAIARKRVAE